jgi:phytol kinase
VINPWLGMGAVLAALGGLTAGLRFWQVRGGPHPELVRKLLHMGMGLVTLSFPWVFASAWPVVLLAVLAVAGLLLLRLTPLGAVLSAVKRPSFGEVYFPVAVAVLFVLYAAADWRPADHRLVLYLVPVLLLAIADAAAALIGVGYGRYHYATSDGAKSAEGSVAFYMSAFFCVHVPLLLLTGVGRPETLLIALLLAWLATMFEAVAWRGLDNLALPLVSYLLLSAYLDMNVPRLLIRVAVTVLLMAFLVLYRRRTTLVGSAMLGAYLVGYVCWAVGDWPWLLAPLGLFLTYTRFSPKEWRAPVQVHNIHAVVCVAGPGLVWLFLAQMRERPDYLLPYTITFAGHLAVAGVARLKCDYPRLRDARVVPGCIAAAWAIEFALYLAAAGVSGATVLGAAAGLVGTAVVAGAFYLTQPRLDDCPTDTPRWLRQAVAAGVGSLVGLLPSHV